MLTVTAFKAEDALKIDLQPAQKSAKQYMTLDALRTLEDKYSITIWRGDYPVLCGGASAYWEDRAMVWSFISGGVGRRDFMEMHHIAKKQIESFPYKRLEAYVDCAFKEGHRWIKALGFSLEAERMRAFQANGIDASLYSIVR